MNEKILWVDDDLNLLDSVRRVLRRRYDIHTVASGSLALALIARSEPFAVVVSDMRMPGMDGIQFLARVREVTPDTVRMMLTGHADQATAIEAVNQGRIFRFLSKPISPDNLALALDAGLEQYRLVTAERNLLEHTLNGAVKILMEVLAMTQPTAFGRACQLRVIARQICDVMLVENAWQVELAAMLSHIGCITVPEHTLQAVIQRRQLTLTELQMFQAHPRIGRDLIARIPRLEPVAEIIGFQLRNFSGSGLPDDGMAGEAIPIGSRILRVALDYDSFLTIGSSPETAIQRLRARQELYDPAVVDALARVHVKAPPSEHLAVTLDDLRPGMILAEDVVSERGTVIVSRGQEVTDALCHRLRNFATAIGVNHTFRVTEAACAPIAEVIDP